MKDRTRIHILSQCNLRYLNIAVRVELMPRHVPSQAGNETSEGFDTLLYGCYLSIATAKCSSIGHCRAIALCRSVELEVHLKLNLKPVQYPVCVVHCVCVWTLWSAARKRTCLVCVFAVTDAV